MKQVEEKIIMFDSPEAAQQKTVTGWVGDGRFYGNDERMARWAGCTHMKCECGNIMEKGYTICSDCRRKSAFERYMKLPFKEYNGDPVTEVEGDRYFFNEEDIIDFMDDNQLTELNLLFCDPVHYNTIDYENLTSDDAHEDWEPSTELEAKVNEFNKFIQALPAHSYYPGKIRTTYILKPE